MTAQTNIEAEQEVLEVQQRRLKATVARDFATLDELMTDELTYVHTSARLETKEIFLGWLREERLVFKAIDTEEVRVRIYGDTGVITGIGHITLRGREQDTSFDVRFQDVWVRSGGGWREVAWQTTRFPERPA
jgi:hypothetical protein